MAMFHSSLVIYYNLSHTPGRCEILSASMLVRGEHACSLQGCSLPCALCLGFKAGGCLSGA